MAGWGALIQPVLLFMVSVENSMLSMGSQIWSQTKGNVHSLYSSATGNIKSIYSGAQNLASNSYEDVRRRAGSIYEDIHVKAEAKSKSIVDQVGNQIHLVYINAHLKINLALNRLQLNFGILLKDIKSRFFGIFKFNVSSKFKDIQEKANSKVTKLKKKATEKVKDRFQNVSLKAREYEDVLEEKLIKFSGSPSPRPLQEGRLTLRRNNPSPAPSQSITDTEVDKVKAVTNPPTELFMSSYNVSGSSNFGSSPSSVNEFNKIEHRHTLNHSYRKSHLLQPLNRSPSLPDILESSISKMQICSDCFKEETIDSERTDKSKMIKRNSNNAHSPQTHSCIWESFSFDGPSPPDKFDCIDNDTELQVCPSNKTYINSKSASNKSIANSFTYDIPSASLFARDMHKPDQQDKIVLSEFIQNKDNQTSIISSHLNGCVKHQSNGNSQSSKDNGKVGSIKCANLTDNIETVESCLNSLSSSITEAGEISSDQDCNHTSTINANSKAVPEYSPNTKSNSSEFKDNYDVMEEDSSADQLIIKIIDINNSNYHETCQTQLKYPEIEDDCTSSQFANCKEVDTEVNLQSATQLNTYSSTVDTFNPSSIDNFQNSDRTNHFQSSDRTNNFQNSDRTNNFQSSERTNDLPLSLGNFLVTIVTVYLLLCLVFSFGILQHIRHYIQDLFC